MALQELDTQLSQLESLRGDLPNQVNRLKHELKEAEETLEETKGKNSAYMKQRGICEMEIKALEGKEKKYQTQLYEVKNNREYDAVTFEIEAVKTEVSNKEQRILELMDLEEESKASIEELEKKVTHIKGLLENVSSCQVLPCKLKT